MKTSEQHLEEAGILKAQTGTSVSVVDLALGGAYNEACAIVSATPDPEVEFDLLMLKLAEEAAARRQSPGN